MEFTGLEAMARRAVKSEYWTTGQIIAQRRRGDVPINTEVRTLDMGNPGAGDEVDEDLTWDKLEDASQVKGRKQGSTIMADRPKHPAAQLPRPARSPGRRSTSAGLLVTVDREINKDTELHPLVRWQFRGGIDEKDRKAFLFNNVVDSKGRKFDVPVAVGVLAASRDIYRTGIGCELDEIESTWKNRDRQPDRSGRGDGRSVSGNRLAGDGSRCGRAGARW
jgi:hypothetical protein